MKISDDSSKDIFIIISVKVFDKFVITVGDVVTAIGK